MQLTGVSGCRDVQLGFQGRLRVYEVLLTFSPQRKEEKVNQRYRSGNESLLVFRNDSFEFSPDSDFSLLNLKPE